MGSPDIQIEPATARHAQELVPLMRAEDAAELLASGWGSPLEGLLESMRKSDFTLAARFNGELAAIWGVGPIPGSESGCAWLLTGRAVTKHPRAFLLVCRPAVEQLLTRYPSLLNAVDARYAKALRWAKWLGFKVEVAPMPGPAGVPFHPISLRRA